MSVKVSELIKMLQKMPADIEVWVEGCDCYGDANGIELIPKFEDAIIGHNEAVLITRDKS